MTNEMPYLQPDNAKPLPNQLYDFKCTSKSKRRLTLQSLRECDTFRNLSPDISFPCRIPVEDLILDTGILIPKKISERVVSGPTCRGWRVPSF
ncbi:hypothetical protein CEXT_247671 [Caerostris extrusa]|uniref:Uncharacterized protein n=1 Tax=Caerostris extrusa TaxID=172846 RepID=A0AAV4M3M9_CAEEX|nr:hypothetical protein CEXT_247671 [Caerostris extrusa]